MSDNEFEESGDPNLNPKPVVKLGVERDWPIRSVQVPQWKYHADTRRYLAIGIIGSTLLLYAILVVAIILEGLSVDSFVKVVAALSPLQSLAAATVGFFFARSEKR
jgi:hypothetical protein